MLFSLEQVHDEVLQKKSEERARSHDFLYYTEKFFGGRSIPQEVIDATPALQETLKNGLVDLLHNGQTDDVRKFLNAVSLPEEITASAEVYQAAIDGLKENLSHGNIDNAIFLIDHWHIPEQVIKSDDVQEFACSVFETLLADGVAHQALLVLERFCLSSEFLSSPRVHEAMKKGLEVSVERGYKSDAEAMQELIKKLL